MIGEEFQQGMESVFCSMSKTKCHSNYVFRPRIRSICAIEKLQNGFGIFSEKVRVTRFWDM